MTDFDLDIDVPNHTDKEQFGVRAIIYDADKKEISPHPSGYYVDTNIPIDGVTGNAAIDYKEAEKLGFIKIDLLTNSAYDKFNSKEELLLCLKTKPDWNLLKDKEFVEKLPHLGKHYDLIQDLNPRSIEDLADCLALIRPGKIHLIGNYISNKDLTRSNLYKKTKTGMYFKKSHAISYAAMIVCVMNKKTGSFVFI